ncbi:sorting nexin-6-like [Varroa jacobsoni]|uniref:Sorting nexin n=1 Tax=Varroa destructor TaxID=109461 RepID=A0A7M7MGC9_VARDE|nr:sorting nexin-6-like [Varroa destructor]XP_022694022.1 sorting nexin-6-like [Varroa jacobsoni]
MGTESKARADTVDLNDPLPTLLVEISDALSERDIVKFTVRTRSSLANFDKPDVSVVRQHEEFLWLHQVLEENETYVGYIIPPAPPRPDFDASRDKLQQLGECESSMTVDEFNKMKAELEAEYLATFKKTVAMHEIFLKRLAEHLVFREDTNLHVFLTYTQELSVRGKNRKERISGLFSSLSKQADGLLLQTTQKDIDESFEAERIFLTKYFDQLKEVTSKADKMTLTHKNLADSFIKVSVQFTALVHTDMNSDLENFYPKVSKCMEKVRKLEGRMSSDADLKLSDVLRYYQRDSEAAKSLLYRRLRALANYEAANRNLEKARMKNKDVPSAEEYQKTTCEKFEDISTQAKQELRDFRARRVTNFKKSLIELADLELKHCNAEVVLLRETIGKLKMDVVK